MQWQRLGEAYLLSPKSGIHEDVFFNDLVSLPPGGRAVVEVECFSCRGDHLAVGQSHLSCECPGGAGYYGDPVAASELDWVGIIVDTNIGEHADHLLDHCGVRFPPLDRFCDPHDVCD